MDIWYTIWFLPSIIWFIKLSEENVCKIYFVIISYISSLSVIFLIFGIVYLVIEVLCIYLYISDLIICVSFLFSESIVFGIDFYVVIGIVVNISGNV